jgi:hypothetical protein
MVALGGSPQPHPLVWGHRAGECLTAATRHPTTNMLITGQCVDCRKAVGGLDGVASRAGAIQKTSRRKPPANPRKCCHHSLSFRPYHNQLIIG